MDSHSNRTPMLIALGLAIALVIGVLVGAKVVYNNAANAPVALGPVDAPQASEESCTTLLSQLPTNLAGMSRAELADPQPEGAAAWSKDSSHTITLRCGVTLPLQYSTLSTTNTIDSVEWLKVADATPGSTLATWYTVNRNPVVAITQDTDLAAESLPQLDEAMGATTPTEPQPHQAPLAQLQEQPQTTDTCRSLLAAAPETIGDYHKSEQLPDELHNAAAWRAEGLEPIVLRCGVAEPAGYQPGVQLQQVNDIPWFEDTTLGSGTTAATWYALGRDVTIAASFPQDAGNDAVVTFSDLISANTTATGS